ncbi:MAG: hypothetical protein FJX40_01915 [Alphaproteobacteria bacterium]|nr:hypothetical protein [Alphaproteobacteria bacterium]MBM3641379.1 hypothetical protein [Alphaproteobacteria bacterium]
MGRDRSLRAPGALLDHAAFGRNRPSANNVIDSKSLERAPCEKPVSTFSQRALCSAMLFGSAAPIGAAENYRAHDPDSYEGSSEKIRRLL